MITSFNYDICLTCEHFYVQSFKNSLQNCIRTAQSTALFYIYSTKLYIKKLHCWLFIFKFRQCTAKTNSGVMGYKLITSNEIGKLYLNKENGTQKQFQSGLNPSLSWSSLTYVGLHVKPRMLSTVGSGELFILPLPWFGQGASNYPTGCWLASWRSHDTWEWARRDHPDCDWTFPNLDLRSSQNSLHCHGIQLTR